MFKGLVVLASVTLATVTGCGGSNQNELDDQVIPSMQQNIPLEVFITDTFIPREGYPNQLSHGELVLQIASGQHSFELTPQNNVTFHRSTSLFPDVLYNQPSKTSVINRSFSPSIIDNNVRRDIDGIAALAISPLVITSAGNTQNTCTPEAAEIGRASGLYLPGTPLYRACDMAMVAAIDNGEDSNWIVVGPDFSFGQKPGAVLKHRWIGAPYNFHLLDTNFQGTSFGAPFVSAMAIEILQKIPSITAEEVAEIIFETAIDMGEPGVDEIWGHGIINPEGIRAQIIQMGY
ncbi:S8 family serine peptidase [Pelagibaculum spongiae]|uniref:Peptidase S8/S53 domain-containing protein n=1 Tax=Pelagibaculum spongiae TaxID=2080658 RepID=A0A2V1GVY8_9GAMM|nr:S8 family serine peptidase [Pelagibaculum spongiae]PVZ69494.1 hypothetical protein DC094_09185 [Pelagibaculum spongiae]